MPKATQSFRMRHLAFVESDTVCGVVWKMDTEKRDGRRPQGIGMRLCLPMWNANANVRWNSDRTEIPRQVLQAMEGHARKHQQ
jgi:hypothetical protein